MANPVVIVGINAVDRTGKAVQSVQANFGKIGRTAGAAFKQVAVGATAALGAVTAVTAGVVKLTSEYAKMDLETGRIAKTTKATVKEVSSLRQEFKRFNLEGDDVRDVLNEINVKLFDAQDEASAAAEAFNVLGLDASALADSGSYEALLDIADGLNQIESAADRAGAADAIFGGDLAQRLLPILEQGSEALRANAAEYERLGLVIDESAVAAAERFHAAQGRVNQAVEGLGRTVATVALPYVTAFTDAFAGFLNQVPQLLRGQITLQTAFSTMFKNLPTESKVSFAQVYLGIVAGLQSGVNAVYAFAREGELAFHNMAASVAKSFADGLNPIIEGANRIGSLIPGFQPISPITVDTGGFVSSVGDAPIIPTDAAVMAFAREEFESIARFNAQAPHKDFTMGQAPLGMAYGHLLATQLERSPSSDYQGRVAAHQQGDFTASPNFPDLTPTAGGLAIASLAGLGILNAADAMLFRVPSKTVKAGIKVGTAVGRRLPNIYANRASQFLSNKAAIAAQRLIGSRTVLSQFADNTLYRAFPFLRGSASAAASSVGSRSAREVLDRARSRAVERAVAATSARTSASQIISPQEHLARRGVAAQAANLEELLRLVQQEAPPNMINFGGHQFAAVPVEQPAGNRFTRFLAAHPNVGRLGSLGLTGLSRFLAVSDLLMLGGSQPAAGRGGYYRQGAGPRSNVPYVDFRRAFRDYYGLDTTFPFLENPLAHGYAPHLTPYTDALGRTFGTNPAFANPSGWYSGTGGPPPIIIENIHVADGEDFVDKVTDAWTEAWREGRLDEEAYRSR